MTGGCLPLRSYSATIPGGFQQLRLVLRNRVVAPSGPLSVTRLELDLGQDLDLQAGKLGETWFRGAAAWGPVKGSLLGRFLLGGGPPPGTWAPETRNWLDAFTELRLDVSAEDRRGDRIHAGLLALSASPSASLRAGLDPLFDPRPVPFQPFGQGTAGLKVHVLGGLDLQWDTLFSVRTVYATPCGGGAPAAQGPSMQQNTVSATWNSPCNCWRGVVRVQISQCGYFGVSAGLDLAEVTGLNLVP
jgi:LPS-assembly protein